MDESTRTRRQIRSRTGGTNYRSGHVSRPSQPWYARLLRIKNLRLTTGWCVLLFEGAIVMAILLALTELVSWWVVPILPLLVAGLVKLNDVIAGAGMKLMRDRDGACPDRPFKA